MAYETETVGRSVENLAEKNGRLNNHGQRDRQGEKYGRYCRTLGPYAG